jgi:hypothetical protein
MKVANFTRVLVPVLVLALTATAFAAAGTGTVSLSSAAQLNGKSLAAGEYKVKWESHSPETDVNFLKNGASVLTARAKMVDGTEAAMWDTVVTRDNPDGSKTVLEIHFRGKKAFLVFE